MSEQTGLAPEGKPHAGHPELWEGTSTLPESHGLEADLRMWEEAEVHLELLLDRADDQGNQAVIVALTDSFNRLIEERRRCVEMLELQEKWSGRKIGGAVPEAKD